MPSELPFVDEHTTAVAADVDAVWRGLLDTIVTSLSRARAERYARLVGCSPSASSGPRPLAVGSTVPGFRVAVAVPGRELVLEGGHRFSSYELVFHIDEVGPGRSRLRAETRAVFPGRTGGIYRLLVLETGGHVIAVRRLLAGVQRRAEERSR